MEQSIGPRPRCGQTFFLYARKIYNDKQLQYKSKRSMEIHNNPKTSTKRRDTNITKIVAQYLAVKVIGMVLPLVPVASQRVLLKEKASLLMFLANLP